MLDAQWHPNEKCGMSDFFVSSPTSTVFFVIPSEAMIVNFLTLLPEDFKGHEQ